MSLETIVDICLLHGLDERLEHIIEMHGVKGLRKIDMGKGVVSGGHSIVVCLGTFMLAKGKADLVRSMATECMAYGEDGKKEAFVLASLLLAVDPSDARRLLKRVVAGKQGVGRIVNSDSTNTSINLFADPDSSWPIGSFVRKNFPL